MTKKKLKQNKLVYQRFFKANKFVLEAYRYSLITFDNEYIAVSITDAVGIGNWALGNYCLVVHQVNPLHCSVCPNAQYQITNFQKRPS